MSAATPGTESCGDWRPRARVLAAGGLIAGAAAAAYHGSLHLPFVFDDAGSVTGNPTIRHLWPVWPLLRPLPGGAPVSGRPLINLSFALDYALSGLDVWSYHVLNLAIHVAAGLALFGIVRRTLQGWKASRPLGLALAVALIWTLHPLQTESVVYISQRAESLMGLFYLLTLYCFIRGVGSAFAPPAAEEKTGHPWWLGLSVLACCLGMAAKEVMATAPLVVLLYDRTFVTGTFRGAWRTRRGYYLGLAATWTILAACVVANGGRGGTAGFDTKVTPSAYALVQIQAVVRYLRLAFWPDPLVFYYGRSVGAGAWPVGVDALILAVLLILIVSGLRRPRTDPFRAAAFAFAAAGIILAPSSSLVPVATEMMAEHRMYLSLAGVVAAAVAGVWFLTQRLGAQPRVLLCSALVLATAAGLGALTARRVWDYRSGLELWRDTVAKIPENPTARNNLGIALAAAGRLPEAIGTYREALRTDPDHPEILDNLGTALAGAGRNLEAIAAYEESLRLKPDYAVAHENLGVALTGAGRLPEAVGHLEEAARILPDDPVVRYNLAGALAGEGKIEAAAAACAEALRLRPAFPQAENLLGNVRRDQGRLAEAGRHYAAAVRLDPRFAEAHNNFGGVLLQSGQPAAAIPEFRAALQLEPGNFEAHCNLGFAFYTIGRISEAREQLVEAVRLQPDNASARAVLDRLGGFPQDR